MKILERLTGGLSGQPQAGAADRPRALTFRRHLRRMSPLRAASWRQLLRLNREAQVDALIGPPAPPPGYSASDPIAERSLLRNVIGQRLESAGAADVPAALKSRQQAVQHMLDLLLQQQRQQDAIVAHSAQKGSQWQ